LIDDTARQHKTKVTSLETITKPDAREIGVSPEMRMEEVISKPTLCYPYVHNIPHVVNLQSNHGALGMHTMVSNNENMT
jgi:hypothetical protein